MTDEFMRWLDDADREYFRLARLSAEVSRQYDKIFCIQSEPLIVGAATATSFSPDQS